MLQYFLWKYQEAYFEDSQLSSIPQDICQSHDKDSLLKELFQCSKSS